ncbi:MAG: hypothetical protein Q9228_000936 [Teloschistes exilis]
MPGVSLTSVYEHSQAFHEQVVDLNPRSLQAYTSKLLPNRLENFQLTQNSTLFRRNVVFLTTVFVGAFAFEIGFDTTLTKWWDWNNKGRQWKDIRHKYIESEEEEE